MSNCDQMVLRGYLERQNTQIGSKPGTCQISFIDENVLGREPSCPGVNVCIENRHYREPTLSGNGNASLWNHVVKALGVVNVKTF